LESDIPHHTKLREEIMLKAEEAKERIAEEFKVHHDFHFELHIYNLSAG